MANNIIASDDNKIIMSEKPVELSDEKLKNMLAKSYERGVQDSRTIHWSDFFSAAGSAFLALFVTLLTADFRGVCGLPSEAVTTIAQLACAALAIFALIALYSSYQRKTGFVTEPREQAVNAIINESRQ